MASSLAIIPARAVTDERLTHTDLKVLLSIGTFTNTGDGSNCIARVSLLSARAGVSRRTIFEALRRLEDSGYIKRTKRWRTDGAASSSRIDIVLQPTDDEGEGAPSRTSEQAAAPPHADTAAPPSAGTPHPNTVVLTAPVTAPHQSETVWDYNGTIIAKGEYCLDVETLIHRISQSRGDFRSWVAEMAAMVNGLHGAPVTPEQMGRAVRDFNAAGGDISLRLFRGYLRDAAKPPKPMREAVADRSLGVQASPQIRKAVATGWATDLIEKLKATRVQAMTGVRVGHLYVPPNWKERFEPEEAKAIASVGHNRLLSHDDITASVARTELVNILSGYARAVQRVQ